MALAVALTVAALIVVALPVGALPVATLPVGDQGVHTGVHTRKRKTKL